MDVVSSVNGVPIRLTEERWEHIATGHRALEDRKGAVLNTVRELLAVLAGEAGEFLAIGRMGRFWLVVPYRETAEDDGFIITAFLAQNDPRDGRTIIWPST